MLDNRKHPRFSVDWPVECYKMGSIVKHNGKAMNASEEGMLLQLSEPLEVGQYLRLRLFLSSSFRSRTIETIAEVAWINTQLNECETYYRSGVRLVNISPEDGIKLKKSLVSLS